MTTEIRWGLLAIAAGLFFLTPESSTITAETFGRWRFVGGFVNGMVIGALFYKIKGDDNV